MVDGGYRGQARVPESVPGRSSREQLVRRRVGDQPSRTPGRAGHRPPHAGPDPSAPAGSDRRPGTARSVTARSDAVRYVAVRPGAVGHVAVRYVAVRYFAVWSVAAVLVTAVMDRAEQFVASPPD